MPLTNFYFTKLNQNQIEQNFTNMKQKYNELRYNHEADASNNKRLLDFFNYFLLNAVLFMLFANYIYALIYCNIFKVLHIQTKCIEHDALILMTCCVLRDLKKKKIGAKNLAWWWVLLILIENAAGVGGANQYNRIEKSSRTCLD